MANSTGSCRAKMIAQRRELIGARMKASRHADAPCFVYVFVLRGIAAIKVGISNDPLTRIRNLPQFHLRVAEVFDLDRCIAVHVQRRQNARNLERSALLHHAACRVDAPSGAVVYRDGTPMCIAPIRWSAGGENEWLHASAYNSVLEFLLLRDRQSPRPSISISEWVKALEEGSEQ